MRSDATVLLAALLREVLHHRGVTGQEGIDRSNWPTERLQRSEQNSFRGIRPAFSPDGWPLSHPLGDDCCGTLWRQPVS